MAQAGIDPRSEAAQKKGLVKKVHVAIRQLGLDDAAYRRILAGRFRVASSKALSVRELEELVRIFESLGWVSLKKREQKLSHVLALRERIGALVKEAGFEKHRFRPLCRTILEAEDPSWCRDPAKLRRLLAALTKIIREGEDGGEDPEGI